MWYIFPKLISIKLLFWTTGPNTLLDNNAFGFVFWSCFSTGSYLFSNSCPLGALMFPNTPLGLASLAFLPIIYQPGGLPSLSKPKIPSRLSALLLVSEKAPHICILSRYEDSKFGISVCNYALAMTWRNTFNLLVHVEIAYPTEIHSRGDTFQHSIKCSLRGYIYHTKN